LQKLKKPGRDNAPVEEARRRAIRAAHIDEVFLVVNPFNNRWEGP
jgi:hypothetical protein